MSVQVKRRRDTAANVAGYTGAQGEIIVDTTNNRLTVHDGATAGGWAVMGAGRTAVSDASYAAQTTDRLIAYTAITAARTVTLPAAASYPVGQILWLCDSCGLVSSTLTVTLNRAGSDTIDGVSSTILNAAYDAVALVSDGVSEWTLLVDPLNQEFTLLSVGTAPDPSNPLSVYGGTNGSALFNGANFNITINKAAATDTASIIFEDGFSGRAQMGLNGSDNYSFKVSANGSSWTTAIALDATTGAPTFANQRTPVSDASYTTLATDREVAFTAITAARIVTLIAASAYPVGTDLVIVDESGLVSLGNTVTVTGYGVICTARGFLKLRSTGTAWQVVSRSPNILLFSASGTYTPTPGMQFCDAYAYGGGSGGGGGALQASSLAVSGGAGGSGGGASYGRFLAAQIGASQVLTIGAGGISGAAATTSNTAGGAGGVGGATSLGTLLTAPGGGAPSGGQLAASSASGGGAGTIGNGGAASGSSAGAGGIFGGSVGATGANAGISSAYPGCGASGSPCDATGLAHTAGSAAFAGSGGGAGGGVLSTNTPQNGGASGYAALAGTSVSGGAGLGANGISPSILSRALNLFVGSGGAGGAGAISAAFAGGAGGLPGGGGGGGGSAQNGGTAAAGGAGGAGYLIIAEFF
jgi:hypothetical protein